MIADALHTQREVSAQIVEAGGDYIWTAKENQPRTHWAIQKLFVHEACNLRQGCDLNQDIQMVTRVNKNRGRIEKRTLMVSSLLNDYLGWPYVAQVFRLEKTIWHPKYKGKTREIVYGLTSLPAEKASPDKLLSLLRQYWGIEAGLHFRRDVTLHEDATRLPIGKSGHNKGGAELGYVTIEAVTYATTVDSLLAIKYLIFEQHACSMAELIQGLRDNWVGQEVLQARALHKAPKYRRDDDAADALARQVMELWAGETWNYKTNSTGRQFRPGMLSWNYWVADSFILPASPDGRPQGKFLSNALCPSNGADINGPTANVNSVGKALGGKAPDGRGDWEEYLNLLPNGGSHTMTFNPSIMPAGQPATRLWNGPVRQVAK